MSKTRISAMVLLGVMRKIGKSAGSNLVLFLSHCKPSAAAIQAAYVILMNLYGAQQGGTLTSQHDASLAALASTEKPESIAAGVAWGQSVADAIWTWRLEDGFAPPPPPFFGVQSIAG